MANHTDVTALYLSESVRLRRKVARMIGDSAAAADLVHDVFLRLWGRGRELEGCDAAYLARSVRNAAIDHIRAERTRADFVAGTVPEQRATGFPCPYAVLEARDGLRHVDEVIRTLPERTRHIFLLNRVHGRSYAEIGGALGLSTSSVERDIARALVAIRSALEDA